MSRLAATLASPGIKKDIHYTQIAALPPKMRSEVMSPSFSSTLIPKRGNPSNIGNGKHVALGGLEQYPLDSSTGMIEQPLGILGQTDVNLNAINEFTFEHDLNYMANVGYQESYESIKRLMSPETFKMMSQTITSLLQGLDKQGRPIIVPYKTIASVLFNIYQSRTPVTGDIYTRYIITNDVTRDDIRSMIDRTIEIIVNQIRNEYEMIDNNNKLTVWTTVYGDFNEHGLRQHAPIKIRHKHPDYMQFNMNY